MINDEKEKKTFDTGATPAWSGFAIFNIMNNNRGKK